MRYLPAPVIDIEPIRRLRRFYTDKCLGLLFTAIVTESAMARQDDLSAGGGVSPDRQFTILVEQADTPQATIYYAVRDRRNGATLGRFKSSYQPEAGDENTFAWDQSHPSWIYWRADSRYVAIDEANHRRLGTVILAQRLKSSFRQIPVGEEQLMSYTGQPWDRGRLFFGANCFLPHDRAAILVIGLLRRPHSDHYDEFGCSVILDLRHHGKIIKAVIPPT